MIKIKAKKEIFNKQPAYRILEVRALRKPQLPVEYLQKPPHCYLDATWDNKLFIGIKPTISLFKIICDIHQKYDPLYKKIGFFGIEEIFVFEGAVYHKEEFEKILEIINICGERLKKINDKKKKELKTDKKMQFWKGEETWKI